MAVTNPDPVVLIQRIRDVRKMQTQLRLALTGVLLVLFLSYGTCMYRLIPNFDMTVFANALATHAAPIFSQATQQAAALLPVYLQAGSSDIEKRLEHLQGVTATQLISLQENLATSLENDTQDLRASIDDAINASIAKHHPEIAKDKALTKRIREQVLLDFEKSGSKLVSDRFAAPSKEVTALLMTTVRLAKKAKAEWSKHKTPIEQRALLSLIGVISNKLLEERKTLEKEMKGGVQ